MFWHLCILWHAICYTPSADPTTFRIFAIVLPGFGALSISEECFSQPVQFFDPGSHTVKGIEASYIPSKTKVMYIELTRN